MEAFTNSILILNFIEYFSGIDWNSICLMVANGH